MLVYEAQVGKHAQLFTIKANGRNGVEDKIDWSPDASRIAFSSPEFGVRRGVSSNVFTVRPDGTGLVKITNRRDGKINNGLDSRSPDGKKIVFASSRVSTRSTS